MASQNLFSGGDATVGLAGADFAEQVQAGVTAAMPVGVPMGRDFDRLVPFDYYQGLRSKRKYGATTNREMSWQAARELLTKLLARNRLDTRSDEEQYAWLCAMLLAHAKNSASVIMPSRAEFWVGGDDDADRATFNYFEDVVLPLGDDVRRFFRVYADLTRKEIKKRIARIDDDDPDVQDDIRHLRWIARERGLERFPELVHDSADACSNLTVAEAAAVSMSKSTIFTTKPNGVDQTLAYREALKVSKIKADNSDNPSGNDGLNY